TEGSQVPEELRSCGLDGRGRIVGVERRVAEPGKMLGARCDTAVCETQGEYRTAGRHLRGRATERARGDEPATPEVENGREVEVDPEPPEISCGRKALRRGDRRAPHLRRRERGRPREPLHEAAFLVDRDQERRLSALARGALERGRQVGRAAGAVVV